MLPSKLATNSNSSLVKSSTTQASMSGLSSRNAPSRHRLIHKRHHKASRKPSSVPPVPNYQPIEEEMKGGDESTCMGSPQSVRMISEEWSVQACRKFALELVQRLFVQMGYTRLTYHLTLLILRDL